jgi:hypothetical protein
MNIEKIFFIIFSFLLGLTLFAIIIELYKIEKYSIGWVWVERKGTAVKEFIKEEDKCIYFIDVWNNNVKTCGIYQIKKYNSK